MDGMKLKEILRLFAMWKVSLLVTHLAEVFNNRAKSIRINLVFFSMAFVIPGFTKRLIKRQKKTYLNRAGHLCRNYG